MKKKVIVAIVALLLIAAGALYFYGKLFSPTPSSLPAGISSEVIERQQEVFPPADGAAERLDINLPDIAVVAEKLSIPWDIVFLSETDLLVSERTGSIMRLSLTNEDVRAEIVVPSIGDNVTRGEGGLLGIVKHSDFSTNNWLYIYQTYKDGGAVTRNRVTRYAFEDDTLGDPLIIIDNIPGAIYHDGGRMAFGPDGLLYIATGDATIENLAQQRDSLAGKILRLRDDGQVPDDNPFGTEVYSLGHRNPQGLSWDDRGQLWSTEHGRSGASSGMDELNQIELGKNYGWPLIEGDEAQPGLEIPKGHSGPYETWAPASALYWDGSIFFAGLRGQSLYEAKLNDQRTQVLETVAHFRGEYGRLRSVVLGPDNFFYLTTSNTDGRGQSVSDTDDRIIRINPEVFR